MDKIVAGEEGRDEQIEQYCIAIRNMGEVQFSWPYNPNHPLLSSEAHLKPHRLASQCSATTLCIGAVV